MALTRPRASQIVTTTVDFSDSIIRINSGETGANTSDVGIIFERGSHTNVGLIWDESADAFRFISTTNAGDATSDINISAHHNLHIGTLVSSGLTYPTSDGTNGQVLITNGSGTLSFTDVSTNLSIAGDTGTDTVGLLTDTLTFSGTANEITTAITNNTVTIGLPSTITANVTGNLTGNVTGNASTASAWATGRTITLGGVLSGNVSIDGSSNVTLTAAHTSDPTITLTGDVTGSATMTNLGNVSISTTVAANSVALGTDTTGNYVATIAGTANEITVSGSGSESAAVTIALPDDVTIGDTLTVTGNLFVDTNTLYVDATNNAVGVGTSSPNTYGKTVSSGDIATLARGLLRFYDTDSSNYVAFRAASTVASNVTWTLPAADGTSGQVLGTDGAGNLSWTTGGGGGASSGFTNSTVTTTPGAGGNYDLAEGPNQDGDETPFEASGTDAFGVSLGTVYDTMEPLGSITTIDYGDGELYVGA